MSVDNLPPTGMQVARKARREDHRLTDIERRRIQTGQGATAVAAGAEFPGYSAPGVVADGLVMPPWYAQMRDHSYSTARVSAIGPPSGAGSEFHLSKNGTTIAVLTLGAGEITHVYGVSFTVLLGEYLSGTIVTGNGAINWSMQLEETAA